MNWGFVSVDAILEVNLWIIWSMLVYNIEPAVFELCT